MTTATDAVSPRLRACLAALKAQRRKAFVPFLMAGDPSAAQAQRLLHGLPKAGADMIELGMPFSDPMADGPAIQAAGERALAGGQTMARTLRMAAAFRRADKHTPLLMMGYYNPIHYYGAARFVRAAKKAGTDGLIVVDLPPEEDAELRLPAQAGGLDFIRLATPTSDAARLARIASGARGFLYYVSVAAITGTKRPDFARVRASLKQVRAASPLPIMLGFGIRSAQDARRAAALADGAVVGSALIARWARAPRAQALRNTLAFARNLSKTIHQA